jgi:hypothetical protein
MTTEETTMQSSLLVATCSNCRKQQKAKAAKTGDFKLPQRWKRREKDKQIFCTECWKKLYLLRALTFVVIKPLNGSWKELEQSLKVMWAQSTAAANWMMTECYVQDIRRKKEDEKMPLMPRIYLYPQARSLFPDLPPQTIVSLEQAIQRKYRAKRYEVIWTNAATLPNMRYPQPFPLHNQSWSFTFDKQSPIVSCRIGSTRWQLLLKSGSRYHRQISGLKRMEEQGELAIYKGHDGTVYCKLVGWLSRKETSVKENALIVRTGKDHLLSALDTSDNRIWIENCDQLPFLVSDYRRRVQRLSEDQKAEQRPVPSFVDVRERIVRQQRHYLKSTIQGVAAHLANFAERRRFAEIIYDDSQRWLSSFPYFELEERIKLDLDERGIVFKKMPASGDVRKETASPLAEE